MALEMWGLMGLIGAAMGFMGGLFGIGGGIIAIPFMVLMLQMDQGMAQGTALVMMVPNLLIGWWRYAQRHPVPMRSVLAIALPATMTTWLLARFATVLDPVILRSCFCLFLSLLALNLFFKRSSSTHETTEWPKATALALVGMSGGISMGLLGIGGGLLATPLLNLWLGLRQTISQSLSLALVAPASIVALATYAQAGKVNWSLGVVFALGGLLTVSLGVRLACRLPEKQMRQLFAVMLLGMALWLLIGTWKAL